MSEEIKKYTLEFHNTYEKLAFSYDYETREDTKEFNFNSNNGKLMYATVNEIISPLLNQIEQLQQENKELKEKLKPVNIVIKDDFNILNELEKWLKENDKQCCLRKLKELKGSDE